MNRKYVILYSALAAVFFMAGAVMPAAAETSEPQFFATRTPTRRPAPKRIQFDSSRTNKIPPADILNQISFIGRGGSPQCDEASYSKPTLLGSSTISRELEEPEYIFVCGWKKNERLTGTITYPDGQTRSVAVRTVISNGFYAGIFGFTAGIDDPAGKYILTMTGNQWSVQLIVNYSAPKGARMYLVNGSTLLFYGFAPSENVRLIIYSSNKETFKGWQEITVGSDGRLEIQFPSGINSDDLFVAVGPKSGEVQVKSARPVDPIVRKSSTTTSSSVCSGGLPSRVKVGGQARAAFTDGSNLRIRVMPGFSQDYNYKVPEGTKMKIVDGPKCADGSTWWKVEISGGISGWVAEYWNGKEYLIEPLR